ncbi:hypothetical protein Y1Q_0008088 [Alligator mississippiensis]|uniref:Uncharacterized protein n=1 Tax=Alligator mississippiensis TaxID=8496 RepID=A0A151NFF3_ALLMI|nr:hypothetical protein Y1Q_0008088 [Alligator mississippiensis]
MSDLNFDSCLAIVTVAMLFLVVHIWIKPEQPQQAPQRTRRARQSLECKKAQPKAVFGLQKEAPVSLDTWPSLTSLGTSQLSCSSRKSSTMSLWPPSTMRNSTSAPSLVSQVKEILSVMMEKDSALSGRAQHLPKPLMERMRDRQRQSMSMPTLQPTAARLLDFNIRQKNFQSQLGISTLYSESLAQMIPQVPPQCPNTESWVLFSTGRAPFLTYEARKTLD